MDATRISDKAAVILKKIEKTDHEFEVEISLYLSSESLRQDPQNHCVPVFDVLDVPDEPGTNIIVMPMLRASNDPPWDTVGELMAFIIQVAEVRDEYPPQTLSQMNYL